MTTLSAIRASREAAEREADCLAGDDFKKSCASHEFPEELRRSMLTVCEAIVEAEEAWFRHSVMMHANLVETAEALVRPGRKFATDQPQRFAPTH